MDNIRKVNIIKTIIIIGFALSVFYHYALVNYIGLKPYPFGTFLFTPMDKFNDFFNIYNASKGLNPYAYSVSVYLPFTFALMYLFTFLKPYFAFFAFTAIFIAFFFYYIKSNVFIPDRLNKIQTWFVFAFMSYPFLIMLDRGNLECWLFIFLSLFVYFYQKNQDVKSVVFLSLAVALKGYPIIFIVLFFWDKKYKNIIGTLCLVVFLTLVSAGLLNGGIIGSFKGVLRTLSDFNRDYIYGLAGLRFNLSVFGILKMFLYGVIVFISSVYAKKLFFDNHLKFILKYFYKVYPIVSVFIAMLVFWFIKTEKTFWKKITLLVFTMLLLPQVSYDYKLIHVFIPLMLFINAKEINKYDQLYAILFGLLLIPKDYLILFSDITISSILNPMIMLIICLLIIIENPKFILFVKRQNFSGRL